MRDPLNLTRGSAWRLLEAVAVLLVLGFLLVALRELLSPLLLFALLWAVLIPFRGMAGHRGLLLVAGVLTLIWLLSTTGSVLAPFVLSLVLAYVLDPLVDRFEARRVPRSLAIALLALPALGALALLVFVALPAAVGELGEVVGRIPVFFQRVADWVESARERLLVVDIPLLDEESLVGQLRDVDSAAVVSFFEERREALAAWVWTGVLGLGRGLGTVLTVLGYLVLTPVLTHYLLRDWDGLVAAIGDLIPHDRRGQVAEFAKEYDRLLSRYLRGQITVALAVGAITGLGLWAARFPYAGTLGLIVAVFSVVPYLGLLLSLLPALFIALVSGSVGTSILKLAVVYGAAQGLEGAVISPRIVGESVGLHPVWVVLALAVSGFFFGFVGLLIAVPGAVGIKLLIQRGLSSYRESDLYRGSASSEAEPDS